MLRPSADELIDALIDAQTHVPGPEEDLLGQVLGEAEGARPARHDGHLQQRVRVLQVPAWLVGGKGVVVSRGEARRGESRSGDTNATRDTRHTTQDTMPRTGDGVARLVVGHDALLLGRDELVRLQARNHAVRRRLWLCGLWAVFSVVGGW